MSQQTTSSNKFETVMDSLFHDRGEGKYSALDVTKVNNYPDKSDGAILKLSEGVKGGQRTSVSLGLNANEVAGLAIKLTKLAGEMRPAVKKWQPKDGGE